MSQIENILESPYFERFKGSSDVLPIDGGIYPVINSRSGEGSRYIAKYIQLSDSFEITTVPVKRESVVWYGPIEEGDNTLFMKKSVKESLPEHNKYVFIKCTESPFLCWAIFHKDSNSFRPSASYDVNRKDINILKDIKLSNVEYWFKEM